MIRLGWKMRELEPIEFTSASTICHPPNKFTQKAIASIGWKKARNRTRVLSNYKQNINYFRVSLFAFT
jgi:hypothetical protein